MFFQMSSRKLQRSFENMWEREERDFHGFKGSKRYGQISSSTTLASNSTGKIVQPVQNTGTSNSG